MALPSPSPHPKVLFPVVVPNMANQVTFEGFLARAWVFNGFRFLRLANHRPPQTGAQSDGPLTVESDYVTVRLDPSVYFDMDRAAAGLRLMVHGRIEGHDIPETIGDILRHCNLNVRIPQEIAHLTITRPAVQVFCTYLEFHHEKNGSRRQPGQKRRKNFRRSERRQLRDEPSTSAQPPQVSAPAPAASMQDASPDPKGVQPGQDVSEVAASIDVQKAARGTEPAASPADNAAGEAEPAEPTRKNLFGRKASAKAAPEKSPKAGKKESKSRKTTK